MHVNAIVVINTFYWVITVTSSFHSFGVVNSSSSSDSKNDFKYNDKSIFDRPEMKSLSESPLDDPMMLLDQILKFNPAKV